MGLDIGGDDYITKPFKLGFSFQGLTPYFDVQILFKQQTQNCSRMASKFFAARTGFQKWGAVGFDCRGIQATVLVYEKPKHGADKGTNFR